MSVTLTCKTALDAPERCLYADGTDRLWYGWCSACWYTVCGGDQAQGFDLALAPTAWLSGSTELRGIARD